MESSDDISDYESLKQNYQRLKSELDNTKSELFEAKCTLKVLEAMKQDYQKEIDQLETQDILHKQKFEEVVRYLEKSIIDIKEKNSEEKLSLDNVISSMEELRSKVTSADWNNNPISFCGDTSSYIKGLISDSMGYYEGVNEADRVENYT
ncbi:unnamed protein product [Psylliodes chrysocephalus]|uniref:Uncharacterized protein n=1 Tax=Psylliodes chrysocephalus TaxID=3402493 RepID=A0A9P0CYG8_9CUCU|nr:unnamed protein product [Psylliodes chrysocephala]